MSFLKPQSQDLFKFCITIQCHGRWLLYFFSSTSYILEKNSPSKWNFWTFEWLGGLKLTKFLMSYLKSQVRFPLNFASLFNVMRDNSYNFYNRSPSKCKISDFWLLTKFHQICTLIGSFCWKYIKFQLKKYRGVMSHDTEEWCKIWRKTDLLFKKWQEFGEFWSEHSSLQKLHCDLYLFVQII